MSDIFLTSWYDSKATKSNVFVSDAIFSVERRRAVVNGCMTIDIFRYKPYPGRGFHAAVPPARKPSHNSDRSVFSSSERKKPEHASKRHEPQATDAIKHAIGLEPLPHRCATRPHPASVSSGVFVSGKAHGFCAFCHTPVVNRLNGVWVGGGSARFFTSDRAAQRWLRSLPGPRHCGVGRSFFVCFRSPFDVFCEVLWKARTL